MTPPAVLFDLGDVILRQDAEAFEAYGRELGLPPGRFREAVLDPGDLPAVLDEETWLSAVRRVLEPELGAGVEGALRRWLELPVLLNEEVVELAQSLARASVTVAVLSNMASRRGYSLAERFGIDVPWDDVVLSGEVGVEKPNPAIFALAAERIDRPLAACFLIDDNATNVAAARASGMTAFRFGGEVPPLRRALRRVGVPA